MRDKNNEEEICRPPFGGREVYLQETIKKLKGSSQRVRRAQILLKADADGPNWTDRRIGDIETLRKQTEAWAAHTNEKQRGVDWQFTVNDARRKLKSIYPKIKF